MEFAGPIKTEPLDDIEEDVIIIEDDEMPDMQPLDIKVKQEPMTDLVPKIKVKQEPITDLVPKIKVEPSDPQVQQAEPAARSPLHVLIFKKVVPSAAKKPVMIITSRVPPLQINGRPFTCSVCREAFDHEYLLLTHNLAHRQWHYQCVSCDVWFDCKVMFRLHLCMHSRGTVVYCPMCKCHFKSGFFLMTHSCLEDVYKCLFCSRECSSFCGVMKHVRTHFN